MISGGSLSDRHQCQDHLQYHDGHPQHIIGMIIVLQGDRCISGAEQPRRLARRDRRGNQRDLWCHKEQTASSIPCSLGQRLINVIIIIIVGMIVYRMLLAPYHANDDDGDD